MSIARFFTTPITVTNPSTDPVSTDDDGVPIVTTDTDTVYGHVQPYRPLEGERPLGLDVATSARRVWLPAGTNVSHLSTLTIGDLRFEVEGSPDDWAVGSSNDHVELIASRATSQVQP